MILSHIFVKISSLIEAILHKYHLKATNWSAFLFGFSFLIFCSCSTTKTVPIETIRKDTIYLNNIQYDSIYIYNNVYQDRSRDTLLIRETNTEYRYKLLRDTVKVVQRDSIPYEVRIIETKEVRKPHNQFDYICYLSFGILTSILAWRIFRMTKAL